MASGEMSSPQYQQFLEQVLEMMAAACADGSIAYLCIDWRHVRQLLEAGAQVFSELKNICIWNKSNAGQGSFYRSQHEMICVFILVHVVLGDRVLIENAVHAHSWPAAPDHDRGVRRLGKLKPCRALGIRGDDLDDLFPRLGRGADGCRGTPPCLSEHLGNAFAFNGETPKNRKVRRIRIGFENTVVREPRDQLAGIVSVI
jgi:hypothetical protein